MRVVAALLVIWLRHRTRVDAAPAPAAAATRRCGKAAAADPQCRLRPEEAAEATPPLPQAPRSAHSAHLKSKAHQFLIQTSDERERRRTLL